MAGISHHHLSALEEDRMIVGGEARVTCLGGQLADDDADRVELCPIRNPKSGFARGQSAKKAHKSGGEESDANERAQMEGPLHDQVSPKKRKNDEVSPDDDLDV